MSETALQQLLAEAAVHQQAGRLSETERLCRRVLSQSPNDADALHLLGLVAHQVGQNATAAELIGRAVSIKPNEPGFQNNLALVLNELGRTEEALQAAAAAIRLSPQSADAFVAEGLVHQKRGDLESAAASYRRAIAANPQHFGAHNNLGTILTRLKRLDEAIESYQNAVRLAPQLTVAHSNLGVALKNAGRLGEAVISLREAIRLHPQFPQAYIHLGSALGAQGQVADAIEAFERAVALEPNRPDGYNNIGNLLLRTSQPEPATEWYRKALAIDPNNAQVLANLGNAMKSLGILDDALSCHRRALELNPNSLELHDSLLLLLHYHPDYDRRKIYEEHQRWSDAFVKPLRSTIQAHLVSRDPQKRLRIGYVSADLRDCHIGRVMLSLLAHHDRDRIEVFCYASNPATDRVTEQLRSARTTWRNIAAMSDADAAQLIRSDQIDILVDLNLHSAGGRLLVFARKPAPVQATWLGYPSTTGVDVIDYRITDKYLDPPGRDNAYYFERSIYLPDCFWFFNPFDDAPEVSALPAAEAGTITFGCFNNFCKVNKHVIELWARALRAVPKSKLLLLAPTGESRRRSAEMLAAAGADAGQLIFVGRTPRSKYLELYHETDLVLDTFPYNGHTTTLDALWMGVPTITLEGSTAVARGGLSLLSNIGLEKLVAHSADEYVTIATELSADLPRLSAIRSGLRDRMRASPLMDAPRFARSIEGVLRRMWEEFCSRGV